MPALKRWLKPMMKIEKHSRPNGRIAEEIVGIVEDLTGKWFTVDVASATKRDLLFQDVICANIKKRVRAFLMFTSCEGSIQITLMGTSPKYRGSGLGSALMEHLVTYAEQLGFSEIVAFTVPPATKPSFKETLEFYRNRGFHIEREYTELWQSGALELHRSLTKTSQQSASGNVA